MNLLLYNDNIRYGRKVRDNFVIDISLKLLDRFQQINCHFKEHLKLYLWYKREGSSLRNKRDINVRISSTVFQRFYIFPKKNSYSM